MDALDTHDGIETFKRPAKSPSRTENRPHAPLSAFCVTVYNEKYAAVEATLRSIVAAVNHGYRRDSSLPGPSVVCLNVDGRTAMDPELPAWLRKMGMLSAHPMRLFDIELHIQTHGPGSALRVLQTIVCIKDS